MGADFLEKKAKQFTKLWDKAAVELRRPTLLTRQPECAERSALAALTSTIKLTVGQHVLVRLAGDDVVALAGHDEAARFIDAPDAIVDALRGCNGVMAGTVQEVHPESGTVSIKLGRE
ncbi:MAG: hypothetical protein R3C25_09970 [Hyphomonadaceae bacterium]